MKDDTRVVTLGRENLERPGPVNPPVVHASTVVVRTLAERRSQGKKRALREPGFFYGRAGNPTAVAFEQAVCELEGGHGCVSFSSGLAAAGCALLSYLNAGDHLLMTDGVYGPVRRICNSLLVRMGVETAFYPPAIGADIAGLMRENTRAVYVESPSSVTFEVQDIPAIAAAAHAGGALVIADNSWATPLYCKPFALGVDAVVHAATKFIVGHSDAMVGAVVANEAAWPALYDTARELGQCAGPDDLYLALRGLRTLSVRTARNQETAEKLARWFTERPEVSRVYYPALPEDPGHALWKRDFTGAAGLFTVLFKPCPEKALNAMADGYERFSIGASWGGFESLVLPEPLERLRTAEPWAEEGTVLRYYCGLEDPDDLIADLEAGFERLHAAM